MSVMRMYYFCVQKQKNIEQNNIFPDSVSFFIEYN